MILTCREMSYYMFLQEKNIVLFQLDFIMDSFFLIKILRKLGQLETA